MKEIKIIIDKVTRKINEEYKHDFDYEIKVDFKRIKKGDIIFALEKILKEFKNNS